MYYASQGSGRQLVTSLDTPVVALHRAARPVRVVTAASLFGGKYRRTSETIRLDIAIAM